MARYDKPYYEEKMGKRYIDADALKELFPDDGEGSWTYNVTAKAYIDAQPTIEPERKKGEWIDIDSQLYTWKIRCNQCGLERSMLSTQGVYPNYCEQCGADMRRANE